MLTIGLTGGIGSGKSTVCNFFRDLGITIISADEIAYELLQKNTPYYDQVIAHFKSAIKSPTGEIDRKQLATIVFNNPEAKQWLENLLHPVIWERMAAAIQTVKSQYAILDIPLLFETSPNPLVQRICVVDTPESEQIKRVMKRGAMTQAEVLKIMATQVKRQYRLEHADDVIPNDKGLSELKSEVKRLHQRYLAAAAYH